MGLDVGAQGEVEVEGFLYATIQHAQPVGGWLFQFGGAEKIACLHDDLEGIAEVVSQLAYFYREIFWNFVAIG